ncbi:hypothetical protein ACSNOH_34505, partial [Streptomyces sp. URMC 127]
ADDPGAPAAAQPPLASPAGDPGAGYGGYGDTGYATAPAQDGGYAPYGDQYGTQPQAAPAAPGQFDYGQGQYAAYSDPYIGNRQQEYDPYGSYGQYPQQTAAQPYDMGGRPAGAYAPAQPYDMDTPPGGVWVPQQRDTDLPPAPQGYPHAYPQQPPAQGYGEQQYNEQHRY